MTDLSPEQDALVKHCSLVMQSKKPETYVELGKLLWQAFDYGRQFGSGKRPADPPPPEGRAA